MTSLADGITTLTKLFHGEKILRDNNSVYLPIFDVGAKGTPLEVFGGTTVIGLCGYKQKDFTSREDLLAAVRLAPTPPDVRDPIVILSLKGRGRVYFYKFREEGRPDMFMSSLNARGVRIAFNTVCTTMEKLTPMNNRMEVDDDDENTSPQLVLARRSLPRDAKTLSASHRDAKTSSASHKSMVVTPPNKGDKPPNKGDIDHFIGTIRQFKDVNNSKSKKRSAETAGILISNFATTLHGQVEIIDAMRKRIVKKSRSAASTIASSPLVIGVVDRARELLSGTIGRGAVELLDDCEERRKKGGRPTLGEDEVKFMSVMFFVRAEMNSMDWGPGAARLMEKKVMKQLPRVSKRQAKEGVRRAVEMKATGSYTPYKKKKRLEEMENEAGEKFSQWMHNDYIHFPPDNKKGAVTIGAKRITYTSAINGKKKHKMEGGEKHTARVSAFR